MSSCETPASQPAPPKPQPAPLLSNLRLETGDLLVLAVLLLILIDGECSDPLTTLITIAAFLLLQ